MGQNLLLITAAYNEKDTISKLIESVLKQSIKPLRWIIVDDGSTDTTAEIVHKYQQKHSFIQLEKLTKDAQTHSFGAKVRALNYAISKLDLSQAEFIGILDADIELPDNYFSVLLDRMNNDFSLGIAGGDIIPYYNEKYHPRSQNRMWSIAGAVQMFKMQCFQDIGSAFLNLPYGGEDSAMEIMAQSQNWNTTTFKDLKVIHFGRVGGKTGLIIRYKKGLGFASLGYHPLFMCFRCLKRWRESPFLFGSILELIGFFIGKLNKGNPLLNKESVRYLQHKQLKRF